MDLHWYLILSSSICLINQCAVCLIHPFTHVIILWMQGHAWSKWMHIHTPTHRWQSLREHFWVQPKETNMRSGMAGNWTPIFRSEKDPLYIWAIAALTKTSQSVNDAPKIIRKTFVAGSPESSGKLTCLFDRTKNFNPSVFTHYKQECWFFFFSFYRMPF